MSVSPKQSLKRGHSSSVSPLSGDLLRADLRPPEPALTAPGNFLPEAKPVPFSRYYSRDFAQLEYDRLWSRAWQYACREEDIPNVGDRYRYDVGPKSYFIVRSAPTEIRAFHNACLHRGTRLCDGLGNEATIRCPFHGWRWNLDGSINSVTSAWDFPRSEKSQLNLPELKVGLWGGYVFVNPDLNCAPLEPALGVLPDHFRSWNAENRFTAFHISKRVRANWKTVMEAFLESYHVVETHSDSMGFTGDANTQYDIWDDGLSHISRLITPSAVPSPHLGNEASVPDAANLAFQAFSMAMPGIQVPVFDPESPLPARAQVAEWRRQTMGAGLGRDFSSWPDAAMIDSIQYYMFPNFCPWWGDGLPLVYQFLPYGDNPDESVMNVRLTAPLPGGDIKPPSAPVRIIDFDEPFNTAPEIGLLSLIFDQDMSNLPRVQAGMKAAASGRDAATLGRYQEQRIQHFHAVLDSFLKD